MFVYKRPHLFIVTYMQCVFRDYWKLFCCRCKLPIFVGIRGRVTHFSELWGNTTHFQNELNETLLVRNIFCIKLQCNLTATQINNTQRMDQSPKNFRPESFQLYLLSILTKSIGFSLHQKRSVTLKKCQKCVCGLDSAWRSLRRLQTC